MQVVLFWILVIVVVFAAALAVQMRMMIGLVLRRALRAWRTELEDPQKANQAVLGAAGDKALPDDAELWLSESVAHLRTTYPKPLGHLRLTRRFSALAPLVLVGLLALGRFGLGVV
ncbi:MAG: hypothetical protein AAFO63_10545 [Pseudomonadota bacterium]